MVNASIMTGYTYVSVIVLLLQVLPRLKCPFAWAKALVWLCHALKNLTFLAII